MEAIVAPSPSPPKAAAQHSNQAAQAGEESSFAPTLNKAINDTKDSPASSSDSRFNAQQDEAQQDESSKTSQTLNNQSEHQQSSLPGANAAAAKAAESAAAGRHTSGAPQASQASQAQKAEVLSWLTAQVAANAQQKLETSVQATVTGGTLLAGRSTDGNPGSTGCTGSPGSTANGTNAMAQMLQTMPSSGKPGHFIQLHNNDSIAWTPASQPKSLFNGENSSFLQHILENGLSQKAQLRNGIVPQPASANPLSTENIIAGLTELSQKQGNSANLLGAASANNAVSNATSNATLTAQAFHVSVHAETTLSPNGASLRDTSLSLRQDVQAQFFEARLQNTGNPGEQKTGQQFLDGDGETSKNSLPANSGKGLEKSHDNTTSQSFQQVIADKGSLQSAESQRPPAPMLPNQVPENELMQQVTQKLRISRILQDSKMVMRLHPAELGNLKIDIHLRDGSVNANIVAQSRQVQEILEKNMPRLRTLMEDQGLVVNEIAVAMEPDFNDNFNSFDEQLAQQDNPAPQHNNFAAQPAFDLELEAEESKHDNTVLPHNGVNVTI
ncbi:MAG: flagellar hook-length control protein FliK [Desulfopila sp.]